MELALDWGECGHQLTGTFSSINRLVHIIIDQPGYMCEVQSVRSSLGWNFAHGDSIINKGNVVGNGSLLIGTQAATVFHHRSENGLSNLQLQQFTQGC
jgi:hypothetical protein